MNYFSLLLLGAFLPFFSNLLYAQSVGQNKSLTESDFYFWEVVNRTNEPVFIGSDIEGNDYYNSTKNIIIPGLGNTLLFAFSSKGGLIPFVMQNFEAKKEFTIKADSVFCYVNGHLRGVVASDDKIFLSWLKSFKKENVDQLDVIVFTKETPPWAFQSIARIVEYRPQVAFVLDDKLDLPSYLHTNRRPRIVLSDDVNLSAEIDLSAVEFLFWDNSIEEAHINTGSVKNKINKINYLKYLSCDTENLHYFYKKRELTTLILDIKENADDINFLSNFPELTRLTLTGVRKDLDLSPLANLPQLKWLTLGLESSFSSDRFRFCSDLTALKINTETGAIFNRQNLQDVVDNNPGLRYLALCGNDNMPPSLSPIVNLKALELLIIEHPDINLEYLQQLPKLRQVSIEEFKEDSEKSEETLAKINAYCPKCLVNQYGLCLGSAWILLLLPCVFFIAFFTRKWVKL